VGKKLTCLRFSVIGENEVCDNTVTTVKYKQNFVWDRVYNEFGIKLHPEIKFIGDKTEEEIELWKIMTEL